MGLVPEAAYWASAAVTPPGPARGNAQVVSSVLLLVVLIIHWAGRTMLYRRAAQADRGFAAATPKRMTSTSSCPGTSNGANTSACCTTPC